MSWLLGIVQLTFASGMESHAASTIKGSVPLTYKDKKPSVPKKSSKHVEREQPSASTASIKSKKSYETKQYKKGLKAADTILKKFPDHGALNLSLHSPDTVASEERDTKKGVSFKIDKATLTTVVEEIQDEFVTASNFGKEVALLLEGGGLELVDGDV
ncbi:hypothetical protein JHK82_050173 [Glycine max]|nr:hypothetical protein JHK82_050173 [Glycine max]